MGELFWSYIWFMQDYLHSADGIFAFLLNSLTVVVTVLKPPWWPF